MTDIQPYHFEPEETLEEEDDSVCFEETSRTTGNTDWCLCELSKPMDSGKEYFCCHSVQNFI